MPLFNDVLANLIAGTIGLGLGWVGREHVLPVVRGRLRQLPKLDRTVWQRTPADGDRVTSVLKISQSGASITAQITRVGEAAERSFSYRGIVSGHQIVLTWEDVASREHLIGAMVLHLSADLMTLSGSSVYYRHDKGEVVSIPRIYRRSPTA